MKFFNALRSSLALPSFVALPPSGLERGLVTSLILVVMAVVPFGAWRFLQPLDEQAALQRMANLSNPDTTAVLNLEWEELIGRAGRVDPGQGFDAFLRPPDHLLDPNLLGTRGLADEDQVRIKESLMDDDSSDPDRNQESLRQLDEVFRRHPTSPATRFALAIWEFRHGDPQRACSKFEQLGREIEGDPPLPANTPQAARNYANRHRISRRRVQNTILLRYLSALSALRDGQPIRALALLKTAIGNCNYLKEVGEDLDSGNAAAVKLDDSKDDESEPRFTTTTLYGALAVAYLEARAYADSPKSRQKEFRRPRGELRRDDLLTRLLTAGVDYDPGQGAAGSLRIPEHLAWGVSNLQRVRFYNGENLVPEYIGIEAAFLVSLLEERPDLGDPSPREVALFARERLIEALGKSASRRRESNRSLQLSLLHWLAKTREWSGDVSLGPNDGSRLPPRLQKQTIRSVAGLLPGAGVDLLMTEDWRQGLPGSATNALDEAAWPGSVPTVISSEETLSWLRRWRKSAIASFLPAVRERLLTAARENNADQMKHWLELGVWIRGASGQRRTPFWESIDGSFKRRLGVWQRSVVLARVLGLDLPVIGFALALLLGFGLGQLLRAGYLQLCRYRILVSFFYQQGNDAVEQANSRREEPSSVARR